MKKTKIICTMGPNTNDRDLMKALALHGMDVARFNFSHGDYEEQKMRLDMLKSIREETGLPIAFALAAMIRHSKTIRAIRRITRAQPIKPSSSPTTANIKSVCSSERKFPFLTEASVLLFSPFP